MVRVWHMHLLPALLVLVAVTARPDTWWVRYDPSTGLYLEQDNWRRVVDPPPAVRWFEEGALVIDSRASIYTADYYQRDYPNGGLNPGVGEIAVMRWRLKIDAVNHDWDPGVELVSDDLFTVGFLFAYDHLVGLVEGNVNVRFEPGIFHTYEIWTTDARTYGMLVDGRRAHQGNLLDHWAFRPAHFAWGDATQGMASLSRWAFFEYGVVPQTPPGDMNCDGGVDFGDISPMVTALIDPVSYLELYPRCNILNGDLNGDGVVDAADINPFVRLLSGR